MKKQDVQEWAFIWFGEFADVGPLYLLTSL